MKNRIRNWNRKQRILVFVNGIFLLAFLLLTFFSKRAIKELYSQQAAQRWESKKNSYAQISVFASSDRNMQEEDIRSVKNSIMETLANDSLNETKENARVWIDAYSGECKTEIRKDSNTIRVTAVGIGNDFFQFHPLKLLSGGYIAGSDLNHDRIVVDEGTAWALFGSNDIVGMQVWMGDIPFVVAGVVDVEEDDLSQVAYGNSNRIYMAYDRLKQQQTGLKITCYEAVMPNPISNYAYYAVRTAFGLEEESGDNDNLNQKTNPMNFDDCEVVENTSRYEILSLLSKGKNLKWQDMRTNSVGYPYWENIARVRESQQIHYVIVRILLLPVPCISLIGLLYSLWKRRSWTVRGILLGLIETVQEERAYSREMKQEMEKIKEELEQSDGESEEAELESVEEPEQDTQQTENDEMMKVESEELEEVLEQIEKWEQELEEIEESKEREAAVEETGSSKAWEEVEVIKPSEEGETEEEPAAEYPEGDTKKRQKKRKKKHRRHYG